MKHHKFDDAAVVLAGANAVREFLEPFFTARDQEIMIVAYCDDHLRLVQLLSFPGCKEAVEISIADIFRYAIGCAGIVVAHNHPSGDTRPSEADLKLTRRLCLIAEAMGLTFLDHLIFAPRRMFSFRQAGLI